jgi:alpha-L-fucosidase 2
MVEWLASHVGPVPPAEWPDDQRLRKRIVFDADHGLTLDAYVPDGAGPFAAAILVHGGGWEAGDRVTYIAPLFRPLAARDIAWFSIDYRLTPQVDNAAQMEDVQRAVDYVRANAAAYKVDPARLVLVGESASGQIVTHLATRGIDVAGVVSFYGVYDFLAMRGDPASPRWLGRRLFGLAQDDEAARARLRTYSPLYHVRKDMPPLLLVTGTADGLQPQAQAFATALRDVGARFDTIDLPDAPHGMEQWHADPRWAAWSGQVVDWIAGVTRR